jgi:hypothetical protein
MMRGMMFDFVFCAVHRSLFNFIVHFEPIMLSLARWDTQHLYLQASALATSS